ncbi:PA0069 family radical SAM protein [Paroceanicella profunda]|uniref:PA0069 family radical SAM protein n=1 Tax=Paroceanicella profunda TaxID=2579971 RepID=A0A5B8FWU9_9RHOB|nr:PA0069 family radical SAM protein [Paroceanicella profunda]QDL90892.1 PA0069 family radical SAM protein [Paroceanicella profunda]
MADKTADDLFEAGVAPERRRGRGALSNASGRFEAYRQTVFDDGWGGDEEASPRLRTTVMEDTTRRIITRNTSPDIPFDRSINPYRGCEHGCIYCFARPTHALLGFSAGLDFETKLLAKPDAARLLAEELRRPGYEVAPIAIGTNTDPYQPIEKERRIMRAVLEVLSEHDHPVTIVTKGGLVARDADILGDMGRRGLARVALSITTLDSSLARKMEPRAATPTVRLRAITALTKAGCPTGVMMAPVIPGLNDHEIETVLAAAAGAGATSAGWVALRMPLEVQGLFAEWLREAYPDRAAKVLGMVRELHGGRDYDPAWGKRLTGEGVHAKLIARRMDAARRRLGLSNTRWALRNDLFRLPPRAGDQMSFTDLF